MVRHQIQTMNAFKLIDFQVWIKMLLLFPKTSKTHFYNPSRLVYFHF